MHSRLKQIAGSHKDRPADFFAGLEALLDEGYAVTIQAYPATREYSVAIANPEQEWHADGPSLAHSLKTAIKSLVLSEKRRQRTAT